MAKDVISPEIVNNDPNRLENAVQANRHVNVT